MMLRNAAIAAAAALAGCALLVSGTAALADGLGAASSEFKSAPAATACPATTGTGNTLTLNPATAPIYQLGQFSVSGTVNSTSYSLIVLVNGVLANSNLYQNGTSYCGTVTPPAAGAQGAIVCGANTVSIEDSGIQAYQPPAEPLAASAQGVVLATATLTAQCNIMTLNPSTITQASEPTQIAVNGTAFPANAEVILEIDANGTSPGTAQTDSVGSFQGSVTAQGLSCGTHQVTAAEPPVEGPPAPLATKPLTVTCNQAKLAMNPAVLQPGEFTHVTGTGFVPGQQVVLTWRLPGGGPPLLGRLSITADSAGHFAAWFEVMPNDLLGRRQLVATQSGTPVTANAVVDGGSMEPSTGGRLIYRSS